LPSIKVRACEARCAAFRAAVIHRRLRIDADDAADIGPKAERQQTGPRAEVDQRVLSPEPELLRDAAKESGRIGRPQFLIQRNRGGEASHREAGDPFIRARGAGSGERRG